MNIDSLIDAAIRREADPTSHPADRGSATRSDVAEALGCAVKLEQLKMQTSREMETLPSQLSVIVAEAQSTDPWARRARPTFLYVMYAMILWAIPVGLVGAVQPKMAANVAAGMTAYLAAIPAPMWALFGTGYLGYTAARTWGKARGFDK